MALIGTAGHVDHGKSTLVEALTGINPMHLPEEHRRELTIELGFAHLQHPDGYTIGIVDVPGHEKLVRTMISGASGFQIAPKRLLDDQASPTPFFRTIQAGRS